MSDNKLSRRNFFKLIGGGVAAAIAIPYVIKETIVRIPVELGWTWHIDKTKVDPTLSDIVSKTLRENTNKIVDNLFENNVLYVKLHNNQKVLLEIEKITPEDQTQRMKIRLQQRLEDSQKKLIDRRPHNGGRLYPPGKETDLENTFYEGYGDIYKRHGV